MPAPELILAFFVTAALYASAGFGGGSTYNALLLLSGLPLKLVPPVALVANILVVAIGARRFASVGAFEWRRFWPLAILSVPAAWIGGRLVLDEGLFVTLLTAALFVAGLAMLFRRRETDVVATGNRAVDAAGGAGLGFLAGVTGIGGGIFLSPLLYLRRWGSARLIAGTCAMFILVNSLSGLGGQAMKLSADDAAALFAFGWPLALAVIAGGWIGSRTGALKLSDRHLRIVSAVLILFVAARLALRLPAIWSQ